MSFNFTPERFEDIESCIEDGRVPTQLLQLGHGMVKTLWQASERGNVSREEVNECSPVNCVGKYAQQSSEISM